tara:strand:- start:320 stop:607 length:288 start_codon:yes stop_codon:yes gene_type:complete
VKKCLSAQVAERDMKGFIQMITDLPVNIAIKNFYGLHIIKFMFCDGIQRLKISNVSIAKKSFTLKTIDIAMKESILVKNLFSVRSVNTELQAVQI